MGGKLYNSAKAAHLDRFNPNLHVGRMVFCVRHDRDMSQQELVEAANSLLYTSGAVGLPICGQSAIAKIEAGNRSLSLLEAAAIAEVLDVPIETFLPWSDGKYNYKKPIDSLKIDKAKTIAYRLKADYEIAQYQIPEDLKEYASKIASKRGVTVGTIMVEALNWYIANRAQIQAEQSFVVDC